LPVGVRLALENELLKRLLKSGITFLLLLAILVERYRAIAGTLEQMTKQQLVEAVSVKTGRENAEVENILEATLSSIAEALGSNERVDLRGSGTFTVKDKKERQGRNPRTGETITIAAKRDASFKPGKELSAKLILPKTEKANPSNSSLT